MEDLMWVHACGEAFAADVALDYLYEHQQQCGFVNEWTIQIESEAM